MYCCNMVLHVTTVHVSLISKVKHPTLSQSHRKTPKLLAFRHTLRSHASSHLRRRKMSTYRWSYFNK